jgi:hypothetical protein
MPTLIDIDALINKAKRLGRHRTKKETVEAALQEYIGKRRRPKIVELFGTIDYDENYDYKLERNRKPKRR